MEGMVSSDVSPIKAMLSDLSKAARAQLGNTTGRRFRDKGEAIFDPVTIIDEAIEDALRTTIRAQFPDEFIWGEENGGTHALEGRVWSLDPIDGTRAFICDLPSWAVLVGVVESGRHVAGMIDLPALDQLLMAYDGVTYANGREVRTSGCGELGKARLSTTDPHLFEGEEARSFERVRTRALVTRYGLDALAYARVATGGLDLVVENKLARHDLDALVAVVRGAGGHIGDWTGGEDWDGGRIVAAATTALYEEAVARLSE